MKEVCNSQMSLVQVKRDALGTNDLNGGRAFNYTLNQKKAKAKLLKGAKKDKNLNVEVRDGCVNLRFDDGSYFELVLPLLQEWHMKCNETVKINDTEVKILEVDAGIENTGKTVDTKLAVLVNGSRLVLHAYNSTQNLMVQGKNYENFGLKCLQPFFVEKIELTKNRIIKVNNDVKEAFGPRNGLRAKPEMPFSCPQCDVKAKTNGDLKVHMKSCHTKPGINSPNKNKVMKISDEHCDDDLKMIEMEN